MDKNPSESSSALQSTQQMVLGILIKGSENRLLGGAYKDRWDGNWGWGRKKGVTPLTARKQMKELLRMKPQGIEGNWKDGSEASCLINDAQAVIHCNPLISKLRKVILYWPLTTFPSAVLPLWSVIDCPGPFFVVQMDAWPRWCISWCRTWCPSGKSSRFRSANWQPYMAFEMRGCLWHEISA